MTEYTFGDLQNAANSQSKDEFPIPENATIKDPFTDFFERHQKIIKSGVFLGALTAAAIGVYHILTNTAHAQDNDSLCGWGPQGESQLAFMDGPNNSRVPVLVKGHDENTGQALVYMSLGEGLTPVDSKTLHDPIDVLSLPSRPPAEGTFKMGVELPNGQTGSIDATVVSKNSDGGLVVGFAGAEPNDGQPVRSEHNVLVSGGEFYIAPCVVNTQ